MSTHCGDEPPPAISALMADELPTPHVGVIQHEPARRSVTAMFVLLCVTVLATCLLVGYALWVSETDLSDRETELACVRTPSVEFDQALAESMSALLDLVVAISASDEPAVASAVDEAAAAREALDVAIERRRDSLVAC